MDGRFFMIRLRKIPLFYIRLLLVIFISTSGALLAGYPYFCVDTSEKVVALTFDDGPNPEGTFAILDLLERYNIKATFFVIGNRAEQYPALVQKIWQAGHQVGNHTWSHSIMMFKSASFMRNEIEKTDNLLRSLGYEDEIFFRPPCGMQLLTLTHLLRKMNKKDVIFDAVGWDWISPGIDQIFNNVVTAVAPGSIILLHDGVGNQQETVVAAEKIIKHLQEQGYRFVTVAELLKYDQKLSSSNFASLTKLGVKRVKRKLISCFSFMKNGSLERLLKIA